jgi:hypothetical protein
LILPNPYIPVLIALALPGRLHAHRSCAAKAEFGTLRFHETRLELFAKPDSFADC